MVNRETLVVVTGASRGLGLEFARQYAAAGHGVIGLLRQPADKGRLAALGIEAECLDLLSREAIGAFARSLGDRKVGLLINNAGVNPGNYPLGEIDYGNWQTAFHTNVIAPLQMAEALFPSMPSGAVIANIGSVQGSISRNDEGTRYLYRATKAALHAITRSLAIDLAPLGLMAIALHPGWVRTDMGGHAADIDARTSVAGMRSVIDGLTAERTGRLYNYDGTEISW